MHFEKENHSLTFRFDSNDGETHLEMNCEGLYIGEILNRFRDFLQGCGYEVDGTIDVVPYETETTYSVRVDTNTNRGYELNEPPTHQPTFDFGNLPNNSWPFGNLKPGDSKIDSELNSFKYQQAY